MDKKRLLIFAWEFFGYHSARGTALAKRPRQVAESFSNNGWDVIYIHKDHRDESGNEPFSVNTDIKGIRRIAIKSSKNTEVATKNSVIRKAETLYYVLRKGDRTIKWAIDVVNNFNSLGIDQKPDYIISFFTPRAPLFLGDHFSKILGVPWIADFQDPIYEGISRKTEPFCRKWTQKTTKSARKIVHISPKWGEWTASLLHREVSVIRHAIPKNEIAPPDTQVDEFKEKYGNSFNVFYGGSISEGIQSLEVLKSVIKACKEIGITVKILLAGNENAQNIFINGLGTDAVVRLGWLPQDVMKNYIFNCDCTLVVPWSKERIGIPSKLYELCSYPKPIWIIGNELGPFKTLLTEWQHPPIKTDDVLWQTDVVKAAVNGDFSKMFNVSSCKGKMIRDTDLFEQFSALMQ